MNRYKHMNFQQKMQKFSLKLYIRFIILVLITSATIITIYSYEFSSSIVETNVDAMSDTISDNLYYYDILSESISMNNQIQDFFNARELNVLGSYAVYDEMKNIENLGMDMNFVSIINMDGYATTLAKDRRVFASDIGEQLWLQYEKGIAINDWGVKVLNDTKLYNEEDEICLFFPMFSTEIINKQIGLICFNVQKSSVIPSYGDENANIEYYFLSDTGEIIDASNMEGHADFSFIQEGVSYGFTETNILKKVEGYQCFYRAQIHTWEFIQSGGLLFVLIGIFCMIGLFLLLRSSKRLIHTSYQPWLVVIEAMKSVKNNNLTTRIHFEEPDVDMETVAEGFNLMLDNINTLMEEYANEKYKLAEAEFSILQTQIQPHFLYNALECIHWQALAGDSKGTSKMIKTLANYYRITLSKGKTILTWTQELKLTMQYLQIQKMRYDDTIEYIIECDEGMETVLLPKLTLQPLIENAIYHAIKETDTKGGTIIIRGRIQQDEAIIQVIDNGIGMTGEMLDKINQSIQVNDEKFGYGIRNVNYRLQHFYGDECKLHYSLNSENQGTTVTLKIPLNKIPKKLEMKLIRN